MFERIDLTMLTPSMDLDERRAIPDSSKINDPIYNKQRAINENHDILMVYYKPARGVSWTMSSSRPGIGISSERKGL